MLLTTCVEPGCTTLCMGGRCVEHDRPRTRVFVRGRPFRPAPRSAVVGAQDVAVDVAAHVGSVITRSPALTGSRSRF
jgi:hypothetical protein